MSRLVRSAACARTGWVVVSHGSGVAAIAIGIGHLQARHDFRLEALHLVGLRIGLVIVADEMEKAMHREVCEVMKKLSIFLIALPLKCLVGDDDVAKHLSGFPVQRAGPRS